MTTRATSQSVWRTEILSLARYGACALAAWAGMAAAITVIAEPTPGVIVLAGTADLAALLSASDTRILDVQPGYVALRGTEKGFVRALYANGAWLVLPARAGGCFTRTARST